MGRDPNDDPGGWRPSDGELTELAEASADLLAAWSDGRPGPNRAGLVADRLEISMRDGLAPIDHLMIENGGGDQVKRFREAFLETIVGEMVELVEVVAGVRVEAPSAWFDPESLDTKLRVRVVAQDETTASEREALRSWATQVRSKARSLRATHVEQRRIQASLTADLARLRELRDAREVSDG